MTIDFDWSKDGAASADRTCPHGYELATTMRAPNGYTLQRCPKGCGLFVHLRIDDSPPLPPAA